MHAAARSLTEIDSELASLQPQTPSAGVVIDRPLDFGLVTERAAFDALENEWNDLFARAGKATQVFQTFNFCWHWANHYLATSPGGAPEMRLSIVTARRHGRLVMVWPLASERIRGVTQTFWLGEPVAQYGDVLMEPSEDASDILASAYRLICANSKSDLLRLRRVRADSNVATLMSKIGATIADRQVAPYMDLATAGTFEKFEERYSTKARKNRRRLARRLEEQGPVEFVRLTSGKEARALALQAISHKARWLESRGLVSKAITDERMSRVFADLAEGATKPVHCVVSALKSSGEVAAYEISFAAKKRMALHLIAFNLAFEKSSAGVLLLEQSLKDGFTEGYDVYDMLAPGDAYKYDWCQNADEVIDWVKPLNLRGYLYAHIYLQFLRTRAKGWLKKIPQPLKRLLPIARHEPEAQS